MIFAPMTPKHSPSHLKTSSFWICLNRSAISWKQTSHCTAHCKRHSRNHVLPEHESRIPKSCHFWWILWCCFLHHMSKSGTKDRYLKKTSRAWRDSAQCQNEMTHLRFGDLGELDGYGWALRQRVGESSNSVLYTCYRSCTKDLWNHHFKNISSPRSMNKHQESK